MIAVAPAGAGRSEIMTEDRIEKLELEIAELRKLVEAATATSRQAPEFTDEEMKAYRKVSDAISSNYGEFCGINDCFRCIAVCRVCQNLCSVCRVCKVCIFECSCGPCNVGGGLMGGQISRFNDLGE